MNSYVCGPYGEFVEGGSTLPRSTGRELQWQLMVFSLHGAVTAQTTRPERWLGQSGRQRFPDAQRTGCSATAFVLCAAAVRSDSR